MVVISCYFIIFKVGFSGQSHPRKINNSPEKGLQNEETDIRGSGGNVDSDIQFARPWTCATCALSTRSPRLWVGGLAGLVSALVGDGGTFCTRNIS